MKKKVLIALMMGVLLSLGACGDAAVNNDKEISRETEKEDKKEDKKESSDVEEDKKNNSESAEEEQQNPQYLNVEFNYFGDNYFEDVSLMYGHYNTIALNSTEYPALTEAVEAYNQAVAEDKQTELDDLEEWAKEEYQAYGAESFMGPFVAESDMYLRRADNQVLSVVESCYSYYGGAHGNNYYTSVNFDVQTGEEIKLESVIADMNGLPDVLAVEVEEKYPDLNFWVEDLSGLFREYITPSNPETAYTFTWTLDYQGVTFYFSDYELGSYADGRQEVMVSYSEYPELFNSSYFENVDDHYVIALLNNWRGTDMDLNGDGVTDYVSVQSDYNADYDAYESISVTVNDNTYTLDSHFYDMWAYFVKSGNDNYLYIETVSESDYRSVSVFKITESSVEYLGYFGNSLINFTNSLDFGVAKRMDLLSTYFAMAQCTMGEDGMPVETDPVYSVTGELVLTSTVTIPAQLVDEKGTLLDATYEFPAGTEFKFLTTDGATYVDVEANDGQRCRFNVTSGWPIIVNGLDAESSFEMLYFAG